MAIVDYHGRVTLVADWVSGKPISVELGVVSVDKLANGKLVCKSCNWQEDIKKLRFFMEGEG